MLPVLMAMVVAACPPRTFCNTTGTASTDALFGAVIAAPNDAWAFGWNAALHWDGTSWVNTNIPSRDRFDSAFALAPNDVWVTGNDGVFHWDGASWKSVDRGAATGFAGPLLEVSPGQLWVLGSPLLRVEKGALVPLGAQTPKGLADPTLTLDASACKANDFWLARRGDEARLVLLHVEGSKVTRLERTEDANVLSLSCVDDVLWVTTENETLACSGTSCRRVEAPLEAKVLRCGSGPWLAARDGLYRWKGDRFERKAASTTRWFGGACRGDADLVLVGDTGATARFDGKTLTVTPRVELGSVSSLSTSREGEPWIVAEKGLHVFRNGAWTRLPKFPGKNGYGTVWAHDAKHVWVTMDERAWRWDGKKWADVSPETYVMDVWGRGEKDVWLISDRHLFHWNGTKFRTVADAQANHWFTRIAGDGERLAVLLKGPRPEAKDGPSTGRPDRVLILENGAQRVIDLPGRPRHLAWVKGELWASGSAPQRSVMRLAGDTWTPVSARVDGDFIVPTSTGALIIDQYGSHEWDGTTMTPLGLPSGKFTCGAVSGSTVWVGGEDAVLRRD